MYIKFIYSQISAWAELSPAQPQLVFSCLHFKFIFIFEAVFLFHVIFILSLSAFLVWMLTVKYSYLHWTTMQNILPFWYCQQSLFLSCIGPAHRQTKLRIGRLRPQKLATLSLSNPICSAITQYKRLAMNPLHSIVSSYLISTLWELRLMEWEIVSFIAFSWIVTDYKLG